MNDNEFDVPENYAFERLISEDNYNYTDRDYAIFENDYFDADSFSIGADL